MGPALKQLPTPRPTQGLILLFLCFLATSIANATPLTADRIFHGGSIVTMDPRQPLAEAVAVLNGKVLAVGTDNAVLDMRGPGTEMVDLHGQVLMPGFIDIHTHPILSAMMGEVIDISGFTHRSREDVLDTLKRRIAGKDPGEWVLAYGWDPALLRDLEPPTLAELDLLAPDNPLFIIAQTLHSGFANSRAFAEAGIDRNSPDPDGGHFERNANGELTGLVVEVGAMAKFTGSTPGYPLPAYLYLLTNQLETYAAHGYTTIVAPGLQPIIPEHIRALKSVASHPGAPVRTYTYPLFDQLDESGIAPGSGNLSFEVRGPKLWIDGSPYAGGMAVDAPYLDNEFTRQRLGIEAGSRGHLTFNNEQLQALVLRYHRQGWQISAHAQGERAIDQFLDAVDAAQRQFPREDHRHRIEHGALITPVQLQRAAQLGVTPSFYMDHIYYYGDTLQELIVGPERANRFMPAGSAARAGHRFTIHTDSPSSPLGPIRAMRTAVLRESRGEKNIFGKRERISADDAIRALTINAAWQIHQEHSRGSIEVGKLADFTVLSENLLEVSPQQWDRVQVTATYIGGERVDPPRWSWRKASLLLQAGWSMLFD
ncbi:amidohydrolase [Microbulbifer zhoushanensis]|uniref:amidohydrolase n=1 Tax=Microbulbifer zhoushanensis TaxID=2904254 RepID=UPI001F1C44D0|nr:amidohydrolase [Microbulbifer zhoushanensis]